MPSIEREGRLAAMIEGPALPVAGIVALRAIGCTAEAPRVPRVRMAGDAGCALGLERQVRMACGAGHRTVPPGETKGGCVMVEAGSGPPPAFGVAGSAGAPELPTVRIV